MLAGRPAALSPLLRDLDVGDRLAPSAGHAAGPLLVRHPVGAAGDAARPAQDAARLVTALGEGLGADEGLEKKIKEL